MRTAFLTTFPNQAWDVYAKDMVASFNRFAPSDIPLLIKLDNDQIVNQVAPTSRPCDAISLGWGEDYVDFVNKYQDRESPDNYRYQAVRFCHKVFALMDSLKAIDMHKEATGQGTRYLIWVDADVHLTREVTQEDIEKCLPKKGDAVS